jgi:leucyl aminopeptidase
MKLNVKTGSLETEKADLVVLGLFEEQTKLTDSPKAIDKALGGVIADLLSTGDFKAKQNQTLLLPTAGKLGAKRVLLLGLGKPAEFTIERLRQAAGKMSTTVRDLGVKSFSVDMGEWGEFEATEAAQAFAEGALMGIYTFGKYQTTKKDVKELDSVTLLAADKDEAAEYKTGIERGRLVAEAVAFSRDLVSAPPNEVTPSEIGRRTQAFAKDLGLTCKVLDEKEITKLKMGSFLGVAQGSIKDEPPRFIIVEYMPLGAKEAPLVFVGKGITFDSGGISIKPGEGMEKMKYDMAGSAAVLGAIRAIAALKLPVNVVALVPSTENMPSGDAIHPGDVLTSMSGKTIEVINTDAEGRLILADALTYAERYNPKAVVDIATLTGACVIALGGNAIGLMGNDDEFVQRVRQAGETANERAWPLPLWEEYHEQIKSDIADLKNTGGRPAGTITAAAFLSKFAEKYTWAHLDIAGTAWEDKGKAYVPKGATGIGVRLLLNLAQGYAAENGKKAPAKATAAKAAPTAKTTAAAKTAPAAKATTAKPAAKAKASATKTTKK